MTDADVDGSHIRTLLLTFFYRHLTEVVTNGNIFIAQPPLYRVKWKSRDEYIVSDEGLDQTLVDLAADHGVFRIGEPGSSIEIKGEDFRFVIDAVQQLRGAQSRMRKKGFRLNEWLRSGWGLEGRVPPFILRADGEDVIHEDAAALEEALGRHGEGAVSIEVPAAADSTDTVKKLEALGISADEILSEDVVLDDFGVPVFDFSREGFEDLSTYRFGVDSVEVGADTLSEVVAEMFLLMKSKVALTRFKGLGEMNPDQLWETTMDPSKRTLFEVTIGDAQATDDLFVKLMGTEVAPRREYIEKHALEARELDI